MKDGGAGETDVNKDDAEVSDSGSGSSDDGGPPLADMIDLDQWEAQAPTSDFAERVLERVRNESNDGKTSSHSNSKSSSRRRWIAITGGLAAAAIAAAVAMRIGAPPSHGEAIAKERIEVQMGSRALAVLEPGANVSWNGDDVNQASGDVFYRVEPGARFTVHTPAGDVQVKGTCFTVKVRPGNPYGIGNSNSSNKEDATDMQKRDVKAGAIGATLTALAFVAVYEGKVAVSHASGRVDLRAGETAQSGPDGVKLTGAAGDGEKAFDEKVAAAQGQSDDPLDKANQNLVRQVGEYRSRLEKLAAEKTALEAKLSRSEQSLAASQDGAPFVPKHSFDMSSDDWKELAKDGTIKFQMPCVDVKKGKAAEGWTPSPEKLQALGLAPQDAAPIKAAYAHSSQRVWSQIKPLCAAAVGSPEIADKIGPDTCIHLVLDVEQERDNEATKTARRQVGEIRAGLRPMPGPNDPQSPVLKLFLTTTGAAKSFEEELAQSFGPEEAHRIMYADELCMGSSIFSGGPKPKK